MKNYRQEFLKYLESYSQNKDPQNLYEPIQYILKLGGKRLRPILVLMSAELFGSKSAEAMNAALAIEMFHNFTLIHDDIMDAAPLRRGKETVHEKWDLNTGILSGDAMLIMAYQLFESYDSEIYKELLLLFSQTAIEVCEGQQYDVDFELREDVTIANYLKMIEYKTAVLVACSLKMGATIGSASTEDQQNIYEFGKNLGIAFQLQDDYLDVFGHSDEFGKQVAGDIIKNKKTYLFLKAMEFSSSEDREQLLHLFSISPKDNDEKIESVKQIFESSGVVEAIKKEIENYTHSAFKILDQLSISEHKREILKQFGTSLMNRTF